MWRLISIFMSSVKVSFFSFSFYLKEIDDVSLVVLGFDFFLRLFGFFFENDGMWFISREGRVMVVCE